MVSVPTSRFSSEVSRLLITHLMGVLSAIGGLVTVDTLWGGEPSEPITEREETFFEQRVRPVLIEQCSQCHGDAPSKGLKLTEYDRLMAGGDDGPVVIPGEPDESLMIQVLDKILRRGITRCRIARQQPLQQRS